MIRKSQHQPTLGILVADHTVGYRIHIHL